MDAREDAWAMWHIPEIQFVGGDGPGKFNAWKTLISGIIVGVILIYALIENNIMQGNVERRSVNIALGVLLTTDVWALWSCVKFLRRLR